LPPQESPSIGGLHVFDSIAFIEKLDRHETANTTVGNGS
jgi:hypothetical protein